MSESSTNLWQSIETAPKDRAILLLNYEGVFQGVWNEKDEEFSPLKLNTHGCGCCGGGDPQPTHWTEIPKLPVGYMEN